MNKTPGQQPKGPWTHQMTTGMAQMQPQAAPVQAAPDAIASTPAAPLPPPSGPGAPVMPGNHGGAGPGPSYFQQQGGLPGSSNYNPAGHQAMHDARFARFNERHANRHPGAGPGNGMPGHFWQQRGPWAPPPAPVAAPVAAPAVDPSAAPTAAPAAPATPSPFASVQNRQQLIAALLANPSYWRR